MANAQPIVSYLKTDRRARRNRELKKETISLLIVDNHYNSGIETYRTIPKIDIDYSGKYRKIEDHIQTIYMEVVNENEEVGSINYYEKRITNGIEEYRNFTNPNIWEQKDASNFIAIEEIANVKAYYNTEENRVVIILLEITAHTEQFNYTIEDVGISGGTYTLDYKDHEGYTNGFLDNVIKGITDSAFKNYITHQKRKIQVGLSSKKGKVYLYPFVDLQKYTLKYVYVVKDHKVIYDIKDDNSAIYLKFNSLHAILAFLNQTIFFDKGIEIKGSKGVKQNFFDDFDWQITGIIRAAKRRINDLLTVLYYTPNVFVKKVHHVDLWEIVGSMLKSNLTNIGLNKEDIILKLLEVLNEKYKNKTHFLIELLNNNINGDSYFYLLYNKLNTTNFVTFNDLIKDIWLQSDFAKPDNPIFLAEKEGELIYNGVILLPYKSDKTLGFYHSNVDIAWEDNNSKMVVTKETGKYKIDTQHKRKTKETIAYTYHPFQPIFIKNVSTQKTDLKLDYKIPAFYLKAVEDKKTVANIYTSIEYAVDIATTLSGIGNLAKLRHITKLTKLGKAINYARKGAAAIEIASGVTNALLKISGKADTKLGKALSEYLFYLEMLSLSVDVTEWISKGLKKSSKEVLKHRKELSKHLDDLVKKGELDNAGKTKVLDEVLQVAEGVGSIKYITKSKHLDLTAKLGDIPKLEREIITKRNEYGVFVTEKGKKISHKFTDNNPKGVDIPTMVDLTTKKHIRIFIHNHPKSSPLSAFDIETFIKMDMQELRAVCANGNVYAIIKKGNLPSSDEAYDLFKDNMIQRVYQQKDGTNLYRKAKLGDKEANYLLDQHIADAMIEELDKRIEYIKYE